MTKEKKKTNLLRTSRPASDIYYNVKHTSGYGGVKKLAKHVNKAKEWLSSQPTYTIHKPIKRKFSTRKYKTSGINDLWQMDLMEMIPYAEINKGYKYILTCIDVFSRVAQALPVKSKSALDMVKVINSMLNSVSPRHIQTDQGKEFYNKPVQDLLKSRRIKHYSVYSQFKCALVERFNRTLREKYNRYFTHSGKKIWYDVLPDIINTYNNTKHRGIFNLKPIEITKHNEMEIWRKQQEKDGSAPTSVINLLKYVRISRIRGPFLKNFDQNWSEEVFQVVGIDQKAYPYMYIIEDLKHEVLLGKFYKEELQVVSKPNSYRIEKIIKTKGRGVYKQHLVKWYGYTKEHNSWIKASQIDG